jgi:hypothetical protein
VRGDPVLLLGQQPKSASRTKASVWGIAEKLWREAAFAIDPAEQTAQRLYSRLVTHYLTRHQAVPLDADSFYRWHAAQLSTEALVGA